MRRPDETAIREFLAAQASQPFSYPDVGASRHRAPHGYTVDHNRIQLGRGRADFAQAVAHLRAWKMFDLGWLQLCWPTTSPQKDATVAVLVSHFGFWSLHPCRVVYVLEERAPVEKFGFAYGTLPAHAERGEERFTVEFRPRDESVWYEIYAFSRPGPLASAAYPLARLLQKKFAADSQQAMLRAMRRF
ncbi:MAG: DUF1990 domain-containing protein [Candidatus Acidiferrales bacterium]